MKCMMVSLVAAAGIAASAHAGIALQIDLNNITTSAGTTFTGVNHTGTLTVSRGTGILAGVIVNGVTQPTSGTLSSLTGSISLLNGAVTGGSFLVTISDGSTYNASITSGVGAVATQPTPPGQPQAFRIDGLTFSGTFGNLVGGNFAGVNVAQYGPGPFEGSMLLSAYSPGSSSTGTDTISNLDLFATVPAPSAAAALMMGLGLAGRRRR